MSKFHTTPGGVAPGSITPQDEAAVGRVSGNRNHAQPSAPRASSETLSTSRRRRKGRRWLARETPRHEEEERAVKHLVDTTDFWNTRTKRLMAILGYLCEVTAQNPHWEPYQERITQLAIGVEHYRS